MAPEDLGCVLDAFAREQMGALHTEEEERKMCLSGESISLTKRQREVLGLLAQGKTTAEIANELGLSRTTVRNHVASLLAAMGVHTRIQAVLIAQETGILEV